jgi:hypothetical protein
VEAGIRARGLAWAVIAILACGICYSIGFQSGSIEATTQLEGRMNLINESLNQMNLGHPVARDAGSEATQAVQALSGTGDTPYMPAG